VLVSAWSNNDNWLASLRPHFLLLPAIPMSPSALVTATQVYLVRDGQPLTLEITIGDDQAGGTSIIWRGDIIDIPPNPQPFLLTTDGGTARTETLHCTTRVRDVNPDTNHTSVTYTLRGGLIDENFAFDVIVPNDHAFATYIVDFIFI
jgi:hypothetical protein